MAVQPCSCVSVKLPYVLLKHRGMTQILRVSQDGLANIWQENVHIDRVFVNDKLAHMYAVAGKKILLLTPPSFYEEVGRLPGHIFSICFMVTHDRVVWWYTNNNILCFRIGVGDYRKRQRVMSIGCGDILVSTNEGMIETAITPWGERYFYFSGDGLSKELPECQVLCHSSSVLQYSINTGVGASIFSVSGNPLGQVEINGREVGEIGAVIEGNVGVCVFTTETHGMSAICIFEKTKRVSEGYRYGRLVWSGGTKDVVRQLFTDQRFVYAYSIFSSGANVIHVFEATGNYVNSLLLTPAGFKAYNCGSLSRSQEIVMRIRDGFAYIPVAEEKDSPHLFSLLTSPFADFCRGVIYDVEWLPSVPTMLFSSTGV